MPRKFNHILVEEGRDDVRYSTGEFCLVQSEVDTTVSLYFKMEARKCIRHKSESMESSSDNLIWLTKCINLD